MAAASTSRRSGAKKTSAKRQAVAASHLVGNGETWGYVASKHNMSVDKLRALNPGVADLKPGVHVKIK